MHNPDTHIIVIGGQHWDYDNSGMILHYIRSYFQQYNLTWWIFFFYISCTALPLGDNSVTVHLNKTIANWSSHGGTFFCDSGFWLATAEGPFEKHLAISSRAISLLNAAIWLAPGCRHHVWTCPVHSVSARLPYCVDVHLLTLGTMLD